MTITDVGNLFMFAGGLGMFLYGMHSMSGGIQKTAGNKMKELLGILTSNHFMAVVVGALVTAIIQSSGATTVMVVGFVNAGIMTLTQAVGVIMGANIGTCITAWIVSLGQLGDAFKAFSPSLYAPLLVGIGAFLIMFSKKAKKQTVGEILVGLGLLFIGLDFMGDAAGDYLHLPIFTRAFELFGSNPILGILIGVIVTAIMQSSSAAVGVLQTLAAAGGVVTASSAMYISLGSNIGSCCTALLSSLGESRNAKRSAVIHLTFNVLGALVWGSGLFVLFQFRPAFGTMGIDSVGISVFHTIFNLVCTVLMTPLRGKLVALSGLLVKGGDEQEQAEQSDDAITLRHLDDRILETPSFAVENAILEVVHMGHIANENMERAFEAVMNYDKEKIEQVYRTEKVINKVKQLLNSVKDALLGFSTDELTVREKDGKVYVAMSDKLLFQSGSARLDKRGEEALGKLAEVLNKQTDIDVFIEGHTDNKPINTVQFKDNWDLSVIRATSVVRILIKNYGVNPLQIQPSGRGEYMPVDDNETAEGRSKNRRTEIIMAPKLDKLFQMLQTSEEVK